MDFVLHVAGIEPLEERLYRALLDSSPAELPDLSATLQIPAALLRAPLDRLLTIGFVTQVDGPPAQYVAVPPDLALHLVVSREELKLRQRLEELGRLRGTAATLSRQLASATRRRPAELVMVVDGEALIRQKIADVAALARAQVRRIEPLPVTGPLITGTGVEQLVIVERGGLDDPETLAAVRRRQDAGETVRVLPHPPLRLLLADRATGFVAATDTRADAPRGVLVEPSPLLDALDVLFQTLWERAIPLDAGLRAAHGGEWEVSPDDAVLLELLAAGLKDQAIARHLGIGLRTVVRRISTLLRTLDAETRFQAGLQAARRGLL